MPASHSERDTAAPALMGWPALALWTALELLILRGLLRYALVSERGWDLSTFGWDLSRDLGRLLILAVGLALFCTFPTRHGLKSGLARILRLLFCSALVAYFLGGSFVERPHASLWTSNHFAYTWLAGMCLIGFAIALDLRRRAGKPRPLLADFNGARGIALPSVVAGLAICGFAATFLLQSPTLETPRLQRELFDSPDRWRTTEEGTSSGLDWEQLGSVKMLAPAFDATKARPTVLVPPSGQIELTVEPTEDGSTLSGGVAVGADLQRDLKESVELRFSLARNGNIIWQDTVRVGGGNRADGWGQAEWVDWDLRDEHDQPLLWRSGDVLRLSSEWVGAEPQTAKSLTQELRSQVGFGKLQMERNQSRRLRLSSPNHPNVVYIVQDTQRADHLGAYGCQRELTPHLDQLAARGVTFETAYATSSWTWPSTASLFTGMLPEEHGITLNDSCYLYGSLETIAERMQAAGLSTAAFTGNTLIVPSQNFDQGFEHFDGAAEFRKTDELMPQVVDWLEDHAPERFFLYLHLVDPHEPHKPLPEISARLNPGGMGSPGGLPIPADLPRLTEDGLPAEQAFNYYTKQVLDSKHYDEDGQLRAEHLVPPAHAQYLQSAYDAAVATGDEYVGRILQKLRDLGLSDRTWIVFTSDHGEELFDRERLAHGHDLHQELVRVPLIIAGPGVPAGERQIQPVSNRELFSLLSSAVEDSTDLDWASLGETSEPVLFSTYKGWWNGQKQQKMFGLRTSQWTLHLAPQGKAWPAQENSANVHPTARLFGADDPLELNNLAIERPLITERLSSEAVAFLEAAANRRLSEGLGANSDLTDMLRKLGYLDGSDDSEEVNNPKAGSTGPENEDS